MKASNNVVMISHFDEHVCNMIVTLFSYLKQMYHNKRDLNVIKNINIIKKLVSSKNNDQLKNDHFIT